MVQQIVSILHGIGVIWCLFSMQFTSIFWVSLEIVCCCNFETLLWKKGLCHMVLLIPANPCSMRSIEKLCSVLMFIVSTFNGMTLYQFCNTHELTGHLKHLHNALFYVL